MQELIKDFEKGAKQVAEFLKREFAGIHSGRATPALLDGIKIDSYGAKVPISNVSSISVEDAKTLRIAPWDKNQIKEIEKAILVEDTGLSVVSDDGGVRVIVPALTTENREKTIRLLKQKLEDSRISLRQEREKVLRQIESKKGVSGISEDDQKRAKSELQKRVDASNKDLEALFEQKEKEVMQ